MPPCRPSSSARTSANVSAHAPLSASADSLGEFGRYYADGSASYVVAGCLDSDLEPCERVSFYEKMIIRACECE